MGDEKGKLTMKHFTLTFDRASVRRVDDDGHLHVDRTPISKANVCPYYGREIPGADALGLDPDRVYKLLRDPVELEKAAATFAGKPLLLDHTAVSADDHPRQRTIGAVGQDVQWDAPYLTAPLAIWDGDAIRRINDGSQKELSSAYRYDPDMTPGIYEGEAYDGRMTNFSGYQVALVADGRAGSDVAVMDAAPVFLSKFRTAPVCADAGLRAKFGMTPKESHMAYNHKAALLQGALMVALAPKLAQDANIDLAQVVRGVKSIKGERKAIMGRLTEATTGKLAKDAEIGDLTEMLLALDDMPEAMDDEEDDKKKAATDADEKDDDKKAEDGDDEEDKMDKKAMDSAIAAAVANERRNAAAIAVAREEVAPYVGKIAVACDSAADVYRVALKAMAVDTAGMHPDAFKAVLKAQPIPGTRPAKMATDAKAVDGFEKRFPGAARITHA